MHDSPYSTKRFLVSRVVAACLAIPVFSAQAQISMTGTYIENFDTTLGTSGTTIPMGWTLVTNNITVSSLSNSDSVWAGNLDGYNAALQTDLTQQGDGSADRGLSIYATNFNQTPRYINVAFRNDTGGEISALAVNFNAVLYAARFDSTDPTKPRWDGLTLQLDPGTGTFATVSPVLEATFTNALVTFSSGGGNPWNTTANGWATAAMISGSNKRPLSGILSGLSIAPGTIFQLRWVSKNGATVPTTPATFTAAQQYNMNVGVDDISITATTFTAAELWRQTYFGSPVNSGDGADGNDFDKDGVVNLLERAFKTIPNDSASRFLPTQSMITDNGVNYLAITYRQLTGGSGTQGIDYTVDAMKYTVEHDTDLVTPWSQGDITVMSISAPVSGVETVTVRLNTPVSGTAKQFIRVMVANVTP